MIHETMFHKKLRIGVMGMDGGVIKSWGCYVGYFEDEDKKDERKSRVFNMDDDDDDDDEEDTISTQNPRNNVMSFGCCVIF